MRVSPRSRFALAAPSPTAFPGVTKGLGWHLHSGDDWSAHPRAELLLDPEIFRPGDLLLLEIEVFNATRERPRHLVVSGAGLTPLQREIDSPLPHWLLLPAPEVSSLGGLSRLLLDLTPLASPAALGLSPDERLLGLRLREITPRASPLSFPLDFSQAAVQEACLGAGWSAPDPSGLWSDATEVRLTLPGRLWQPEICAPEAAGPGAAQTAPDASESAGGGGATQGAQPGSARGGASTRGPGTPGAMLEIDASVLPRPEGRPPLTLRLEAGGQILLSRELSAADPQPIRCPLHGLWGVAQPLELVLRFENLASPAELGINADPRYLGIFLRGIALIAEPWGSAGENG